MARAYRVDPSAATRDLVALIDDLGITVAGQYGEVELRLIELLAKFARAGLAAPDELLARSAAVRALRAEALTIIGTVNGADLARRVLAVAQSEGAAAAVADLGILPGIPTVAPIPPTSAVAVASLTLDLTNTLDNMQERIVRYVDDAYRRVVGIVSPRTLLGVDTIDTTRKAAVERFLGQGITGFTDKAGRDWKIGSYSEMATRTTVHRAWQEANIEQTKALTGVTLATIVRGVDSCRPCARWGGKIVSTDGTPAGTYELEHATDDGLVPVTVSATIEQARADGWDHPNCRCRVVAYLPGLSLPSAQESTWNPQAEKDRDRLRTLERRVRDYKRRAAGSLDDVTAARYKRKARAVQVQIRDHVDATGLKRQTDRESLSFSDGKPNTIPTVAPKAIGS